MSKQNNTSGLIKKKVQHKDGNRRPIQTASLGSVAKVDLESQVQYEKTDITSFYVPLGDIPYTIPTQQQQSGLCRVYDVVWAMPGYSLAGDNLGSSEPEGGSLCDVGQSKISVLNESPETVYMRLQRPMGYRDSPNSLAMWEPCKKSEAVIPIKPHTHHKFTFENSSTSHMVPRQLNYGGSTCLDLATLYFTREPYSDMGADLSTANSNSIGLQVEVQIHYKTSDTVVGETVRFAVQVYDNPAILDMTNSGPPQNVRVAEMRSGNYYIKYIHTLPTGNCEFIDTNNVKSSLVNGLDTQTVYLTPWQMMTANQDPNMTTASCGTCIAFNKDGTLSDQNPNTWLVCQLYPDTNVLNYKIKIKACTSSKILEAGFPPNSVFRPVAVLVSVVGGKTSEVTMIPVHRSTFRRGLRLRSYLAARRHSSYLAEHLYGDSLATHVLDTLTTIAKIVKIGVEIAGLVGLLAVPIPSGKTKRVISAHDQLATVDRCDHEYEMVESESSTARH